MKRLDYKAAHEFVDRNRNAFWDSWTMVLFTPARAGATHPKGMLRDGKWGIAVRIQPNKQGMWLVR